MIEGNQCPLGEECSTFDRCGECLKQKALLSVISLDERLKAIEEQLNGIVGLLDRIGDEMDP